MAIFVGGCSALAAVVANDRAHDFLFAEEFEDY